MHQRPGLIHTGSDTDYDCQIYEVQQHLSLSKVDFNAKTVLPNV